MYTKDILDIKSNMNNMLLSKGINKPPPVGWYIDFQ